MDVHEASRQNRERSNEGGIAVDDGQRRREDDHRHATVKTKIRRTDLEGAADMNRRLSNRPGAHRDRVEEHKPPMRNPLRTKKEVDARTKPKRSRTAPVARGDGRWREGVVVTITSRIAKPSKGRPTARGA